MKLIPSLTFSAILFFSTQVDAQKKWTEQTKGNISVITNNGGQTIGYSTASGIKIITIDGFGFKDLNKNGRLDKYEDWRLTADVRAKDLASRCR